MAVKRRTHWRDAMLIPQGWGEREDKPRSTRWPKGLMSRVEKVAKESGHDYTTALFHLLKWALDEYDAQREAERGGSRPKSDARNQGPNTP